VPYFFHRSHDLAKENRDCDGVCEGNERQFGLPTDAYFINWTNTRNKYVTIGVLDNAGVAWPPGITEREVDSSSVRSVDPPYPGPTC